MTSRARPLVALQLHEQPFKPVSQPRFEADRQLQVVTGGSDRDRAVVEASVHGGER